MRRDPQTALKYEIGFGQPKPEHCFFTDAVNYLRELFAGLKDCRIGPNRHYPLADIGLSAFSVFFTQSESFLDFQRLMQEKFNCNNARTLFGIKEIPSDNHIRQMLDGIEPKEVFPADFLDKYYALVRSTL